MNTPKKLLIIDDDPDYVAGIKAILETAKYAVDVAHNRKYGFLALQSKAYDLLLLDIMMGRGAEGVALARKIRKDAKLKEMPVLIITGTSPRSKRAELFDTLEGSLRRLRIDRIDVYFDHAVNDPDRLRNDEWYEFSSRAKQQGKIRFTGISGHVGRLVECLELAVEERLVDVVLCAYNFGQDPAFYERFTGSFDFVARQPELPRLLRKARAAGIGVVAMKTLRGARLNDMRPYEGAGATFAQAAFRWIFASGLAGALDVTMKSPAQVDEYLGASGWTAPHPADAYKRLVCETGRKMVPRKGYAGKFPRTARTHKQKRQGGTGTHRTNILPGRRLRGS